MSSSGGKFLVDGTLQAMADVSAARDGDLLLLLAGPAAAVYEQMGQLRLIAGGEFDLIDEDRNEFLWVTGFPLFEWSKEDLRYHSLHHPFTSPKEEDLPKLAENPGEVTARAYDLVLNGKIGRASCRERV